MPLIKKPFTSYTLEEETKNKDIFTVRVNKEERAILEEIKEDLNIKSDSKALKLAAFIGKNVLQGTFTRPILKYLFSKERQKLEDFNKL